MSQLVQEKSVSGIGSYPRIDGDQRVSGRAKYGADWKRPEMLYGRVATSTVPHGVVKRIDTARASAIPGVKAIITCLDDGTIWHGGDRDHERRVLAERVRFFGETIAAVAATSRSAAQAAVQAIEAEYQELPAVFSLDEARKDGAPRVWDEGNLTQPITKEFGDVGATFRSADLVVEAAYSSSRVARAQLEPPVSLAWWEGDALTVVATTQTIHMARDAIARDMGIPLEKVRVITLYKGGGFGGGGSTNFDAIAALLSRKTGRPVMVEVSRPEDFFGTHSRWSSVQQLRGAVSVSDAKLLALDVKAYCGIGAYVRFRQGLAFVDGPDTYYDYKAWRSEVAGVHTNTPATGYVRAPAGPHSCFAAESFIDEIADRLAVNPLEFRLKNAVTSPLGEHLTSNGLVQCLRSGAERFGWSAGWHLPPKGGAQDAGPILSGTGLAVATWHSAVGPGQAAVKLNRDGSLEVRVGVVDIGTGAKSTMAVIAAEALSLPLKNVRVVWGDTSVSPFARGEVGSMTTNFTGTAVREAAGKVKQRIVERAAARLGVAPSALTLVQGNVVAPDGRKVAMEVLAAAGERAIEETAATEPKLPDHAERLSFAAHFAEVEVDRETGEVRVTRYVAAQDSGKIVNRLTAESQVQGSVIMGIGMALTEGLVIDEGTGGYQNPNFRTYRLPEQVDIPKIDVIFADVDDPYGPKSVGETSIVPVPAAIGNAVFNATGKRLRKLPFLADDVLRALETA